MPSYAYVRADLKCRTCNGVTTDLVGFAWGFCLGFLPSDEDIYSVGDALRWRTCRDGTIPTWTLFLDNGASNLGDPVFPGLVIRDTSDWNWRRSSTMRCSSCGQLLGNAAVRIRDNRIDAAWLYVPGELSEQFSHYLMSDDEVLKPMFDWEEHPVDVIRDC